MREGGRRSGQIAVIALLALAAAFATAYLLARDDAPSAAPASAARVQPSELETEATKAIPRPRPSEIPALRRSPRQDAGGDGGGGDTGPGPVATAAPTVTSTVAPVVTAN